MSLASRAIIILTGIRFPENAGMVARACANMGCQQIRLVKPERYEPIKAWPLATAIGRPLLENIHIFNTISEAVQDLAALFGTSARIKGRRKQIISPVQLADQLAMKFSPEAASETGYFGILFGPEDRGLSNQELALCQSVINIPTAAHASSLNLAQAVLLILYELNKDSATKNDRDRRGHPAHSISVGELQLLEEELQAVLMEVGVLSGQNVTYFFSQWHDMLSRVCLKRHEYDALMGACRKFKNKYLK